ncbi:unnamed protein product [Urochloa humidicola]
MASPQPQPQPPERRRPPPAKPHTPSSTTIHDLGNDLLLDIFLRLPSLPSLVRAALACRPFLAAVRSSPAFRRRFREHHAPPLVGFFFESDGSDIPSFSPIRRRADPDLAAAVRGADVFLTRLPYHEEASTGWDIAECRGGHLLLYNWDIEKIAVYNPLTRALDLLPTPPDEVSNGCRGKFSYDDFFLFYDDETPGLFRVVLFCHDKSRLRAAVFRSRTREWQILPWSGPAPAQRSGKHWLLMGTQANGKLYCAHAKQAYTVVLDSNTLQFSFMELPEYLKGQGQLYTIGETKNGKLCMVSVVGFTLQIWFPRADADGIEKFMVHSVIPLEGDILRLTDTSLDDYGPYRIKVWSVLNGTVYFSPLLSRDPGLPYWFLSLCLETRKLEKLFHKTFDNHVFPYIMAWPPALVGNNGRP